MAIAVAVPRLGWSMDEGTFAEWLKQDGDTVRPGDLLFVLEGDKAAQEVECFDGGLLRVLPDGPRPGDIVQVGQVLAYLVAPGEPAPFEVAPPQVPDSAALREPAAGGAGTKPQEPVVAISSTPVVARADPGSLIAAADLENRAANVSGGGAAGPAVRRMARALRVDLATVAGSGPGARILVEDVTAAAGKNAAAQRPGNVRYASPRARRLATELGIDWTLLTGTGRDGRVRAQDVLVAPRSDGSLIRQPDDAGTAAASRQQPHSTHRRLVARRMLDSHLTTAPVTLTTTADVTHLVSLRQQFSAAAATPEAIIPSYTDFIIKLTSLALLAHPALNARWDDTGITTFSAVHIGFAVDTEFGLVVPVVRHVERLTLRSLARQTRELIEKARAHRLSATEMQEGTFTVTNLGGYGIDAFTPIINGPQCAILGVGRILKQPVFVEGRFVPRDVLTLSLTFDHRLVDGGPAARFLQMLVQAIENPAERLIG